MKEIPLTQGKVALVDDQDFEFVNQWKWHAHKLKAKSGKVYWYARRANMGENGKRVYMHRLIIGLYGNFEADHKDHNCLNNQRSNLRPATHGQNAQNAIKRKGCSSSFKGVCRHSQCNRWKVQVDGRYVGIFRSEIEAAKMYNSIAYSKFKNFALLNSIT